MDEAQLKAFLETDAGKAFLEEQKKPLITKRDELLSEVKALKEKYKQVEEFGDVETLKTIVAEHKQSKEKVKQTEEEALRKTGNFAALEENLRKELATKEQAVEEFKNKAISSRLDADLTSAITEAKGVPELLKPLLSSRVKGSFDTEGKIVLEVVDEYGKPMYVGGNPGTVKDLVESFKTNEVYGRAFEGSGASGSGTRKSTTTSGNQIELDPSKPGYSVSAAMAYYKKHPHLLKK